MSITILSKGSAITGSVTISACFAFQCEVFGTSRNSCSGLSHHGTGLARKIVSGSSISFSSFPEGLQWRWCVPCVTQFGTPWAVPPDSPPHHRLSTLSHWCPSPKYQTTSLKESSLYIVCLPFTGFPGRS